MAGAVTKPKTRSSPSRAPPSGLTLGVAKPMAPRETEDLLWNDSTWAPTCTGGGRLTGPR